MSNFNVECFKMNGRFRSKVHILIGCQPCLEHHLLAFVEKHFSDLFFSAIAVFLNLHWTIFCISWKDVWLVFGHVFSGAGWHCCPASRFSVASAWGLDSVALGAEILQYIPSIAIYVFKHVH